MAFPEGNAVVYCEKNFSTTNGKTAHGLVRKTFRYHVCAVIDSAQAGADAGGLLEGTPNGIPILKSVSEAVEKFRKEGKPLTHFVMGLAPEGGGLSSEARAAILEAIALGLNVDCGLHDFLSDDGEIVAKAKANQVSLRDIRRPPSRKSLHFFSGKIQQVTALKIALLGTDSAVGKRTTAWKLVEALQDRRVSSELIGTGQTAWLQGARYGIVLDSLVNDFVAGELEHATFSAWQETGARVLVIEGQGSLMNPAYPGGLEILAACRPEAIVLQHAPKRKEYDGFPGFPIHPIKTQIRALELVSGRPVVALTLNYEGLKEEERGPACEALTNETGLPCWDVLKTGAAGLAEMLLRQFPR